MVTQIRGRVNVFQSVLSAVVGILCGCLSGSGAPLGSADLEISGDLPMI